MIIVRLTGGLGNQMFQYGAGRRLALHTGAELKLDTSAYATLPDREYALGAFPIRAELAGREEIERLTEPTWAARLGGRVLGRRPRPPASHVREPDWSFHPEILELGDGVYLEGYWQSERYFSDVADTIRRELAPPASRAEVDRRLADRIEATEAVSVHVRRGDYLTSKIARETLGPCGRDYYRRAVELISQRLAAPHAFLFSDDPDWVRDNLELPWPRTVVGADEPRAADRDLALMSRCRHHIIANSSFSWWGAWLGEADGSVVVAPRRWFAREDLSSRDLVPGRWERL